MTAEQAADCMCECLRLAALTDDPQIRNQLTQQAQHWMAVSMPALRATRGQAWPFLYADEHAPGLTLERVSNSTAAPEHLLRIVSRG